MASDGAKSNCRKFAPNMFNKNKCQACFKNKGSHSAEALENSKAARKVSKCGYLFVAPQNLDFGNPLDRTRRWQRRWFVLYDDGELTYSLDEHPDTIPQGVIDMNKCTDVLRSEGTTGHEYSITVTASGKSEYLKGTSREEINWWYDVLVMFPRSLKTRPKRVTYPTSKQSIPTPDEIKRQQEEMAVAAAAMDKLRQNRESPSRQRHQSSPSPSGSLLALNIEPAKKRSSHTENDYSASTYERHNSWDNNSSQSHESSERDDADDRSSEERDETRGDVAPSGRGGGGDTDAPRLTPRMVKNQSRRKKSDSMRRSRSNVDVGSPDADDAAPVCLRRSSSNEDLTDVGDGKNNNNKAKYVAKSPRQIGSRINDAILSELEQESAQYQRRIMNTNGLISRQVSSPPKMMSAAPSLPAPPPTLAPFDRSRPVSFDTYLQRRDSGWTSEVRADKRASDPRSDRKVSEVVPDNRTTESRSDNRSTSLNKSKIRENIENEKNKTNISVMKEKSLKEEVKKESSPKRESRGEAGYKTNAKKGFPTQPQKPRLRSRSVSPQRRKEKENGDSVTHSPPPNSGELSESKESEEANAEMERIKDPAYIKKGWLLKEDSPDKAWNRHWFVLKGPTLSFYKDQQAEERNDTDDVINLCAVDRVSKLDVPKNFGFQIQTKESKHILSALTEGIRNNWMQALAGSIEAQQLIRHLEASAISGKQKPGRRSDAKAIECMVEQSPERNVPRVSERRSKHKSSAAKKDPPADSPDKDINKNELKSSAESADIELPAKRKIANISKDVPSEVSSESAKASAEPPAPSTMSPQWKPSSALTQPPPQENQCNQPASVVDAETRTAPPGCIAVHPADAPTETVSLSMPARAVDLDISSDSDRDTPRRFSVDRPDSNLDRVDGVAKHAEHRSPTSQARSRSRSRSKSPKPGDRRARQPSKEEESAASVQEAAPMKPSSLKHKHGSDSKTALTSPPDHDTISSTVDTQLLQAEVESLQQRLEQMQRELLHSHQENVELKTALAAQGSSSESAPNQSDLEKQVTALMREKNKLHVSMKAAELQLAEARKVTDVAKNQTDMLKKNLHETKETIFTQQGEIGRLRAGVDSYSARAGDLEGAVHRAEQQQAREKEKFVAMNQEWDKHFKALERDLTAAEARARTHKAVARDLAEKVAFYEELAREEEDHSRLIGEQCRIIEELQGELNELERARGTDAVPADDDDRALKQLQLDDVLGKLGEAERKLEDTERRLVAEELKVEAAERKLEEAEADVAMAEQEKREQLDKLRDLDETLRHQEALISTLRRDAAEANTLREEAASLSAQCDKMRSALSARDDKARSLRDELSGALRTNAEVRESLGETSRRNAQLSQGVAEASRQVSELSERLEAAARDRRELAGDVEEARAEASDARAAAERAGKDGQRLRAELAGVHAENDKLEICVEELQAACVERERGLAEARAAHAEARDALAETRASLAAESDRLQGESACARQQADGALAETRREREEAAAARAVADRLERELAAATAAQEELRQAKARLQEGLSHVQEDYRDQIAIMNGRVHELSGKLSAAERASRLHESQLHSAQVERMARSSKEQAKVARSRDVTKRIERLEARLGAIDARSSCAERPLVSDDATSNLAVPDQRKSGYAIVTGKLKSLEDSVARAERALDVVTATNDDDEGSKSGQWTRTGDSKGALNAIAASQSALNAIVAADDDDGLPSDARRRPRTAESVIRHAQVALENLIQELDVGDAAVSSPAALRESLIHVQKLLGTECGGASSFELGLVERLLAAWSGAHGGAEEGATGGESRAATMALFARKLAFETVLLGEMAHALAARGAGGGAAATSLEDTATAAIFPALVERIQLQGEVCDIYDELSTLVAIDVKSLHQGAPSVAQQPALSLLAGRALASANVDANLDKLHDALQEGGFAITTKAVMQAELLLGLRHMKRAGCSREGAPAEAAAAAHEPAGEHDGLELIYDAVQLAETQKLADEIIDKQLGSHLVARRGDGVDAGEREARRAEDLAVSARLRHEILTREPVIRKYGELEDRAVRIEAANAVLKDYLSGLSEFAGDVVREGLHRAELTYVRQRLRQQAASATPSAAGTIQSLTMQSSQNIAGVRGRYEQLLEDERAEFVATLAKMQRRVAELEQQAAEPRRQVDSAAAAEDDPQGAPPDADVCGCCREKRARAELAENPLHAEREADDDDDGCAAQVQARLAARRERHDAATRALTLDLQETREKLRLAGLEVAKETESVAELTEHIYRQEEELAELRAAAAAAAWRRQEAEEEGDATRQVQHSDSEADEDTYRSLTQQVRELELYIIDLKKAHVRELAEERCDNDRRLTELETPPVSDEAIKHRFQAQTEQLKEMCERGSLALQMSHRQIIIELRDRHRKDMEERKMEQENLLAEETAATRAALDIIKKDHQMELEKEVEKIRTEYENDLKAVASKEQDEKLEMLKHEVSVLSEQYSLNLLENATQAEALEKQKKLLRGCTQDIVELRAKNKELLARLGAEASSTRNDDSISQKEAKDEELYSLKVKLRVKEAELADMRDEMTKLKEKISEDQKNTEKIMKQYSKLKGELGLGRAERLEQSDSLHKSTQELDRYRTHQSRSRERRRIDSDDDRDNIPTNEKGTPAFSEPKSKPQVTLRKKLSRRSQSSPGYYRYTVDLGPDGWFSLQTPAGIVQDRRRYFEEPR